MALKSGVNGPCDPYVNYKCLDTYLGDNPVVRFFRYYELEWGKGVAPSDPSAPPGRRSDAAWPPTPQSSPAAYHSPNGRMAARLNIGTTRPNSVDSPLMVAIANTGAGKLLSDAHIQIYGWINGGGNISTNKTKPGGNVPAAYDYTPNTFQLDQAVVYVERLPDTVQLDHFDWGFRFSALVWRELSLHDRLRSGELPAAEPQSGQRLRFPDGLYGPLLPGLPGHGCARRPLHLDS